ncbi:hypothetical protein U1Q18_022513 [Sarracenia purpurea var. burkii]
MINKAAIFETATTAATTAAGSSSKSIPAAQDLGQLRNSSRSPSSFLPQLQQQQNTTSTILAAPDQSKANAGSKIATGMGQHRKKKTNRQPQAIHPQPTAELNLRFNKQEASNHNQHAETKASAS